MLYLRSQISYLTSQILYFIYQMLYLISQISYLISHSYCALSTCSSLCEESHLARRLGPRRCDIPRHALCPSGTRPSDLDDHDQYLGQERVRGRDTGVILSAINLYLRTLFLCFCIFVVTLSNLHSPNRPIVLFFVVVIPTSFEGIVRADDRVWVRAQRCDLHYYVEHVGKLPPATRQYQRSRAVPEDEESRQAARYSGM